jgi:hypothetical protein
LHDAVTQFTRAIIYSIVVSILLLLLLGNASHNLFRFNWLWFGAFQAIAVLVLRRDVSTAADSARFHTGVWPEEITDLPSHSTGPWLERGGGHAIVS